jgi:hypothetical protein
MMVISIQGQWECRDSHIKPHLLGVNEKVQMAISAIPLGYWFDINILPPELGLRIILDILR